jgi:hypothetical protein
MKLGGWFICAAVGLAACGSPSPLGYDGGAGKGGGGSGAAAGTNGAAGTGAAGTGSAGANADGGGDAAAVDVGGGGPDADGSAQRETVHWGTKRDLDLLFMIDNSFSVKLMQQRLLANFPVFMDVLKNLPSGLPNLHLAVVSSDLGAGAFNEAEIPNCRHGGDQGVFQFAPRGTTCANGKLDPGQSFISNVGGQPNYTGDISDVFSCIAALGDGGCGFEHPFASVLRALGADGAGPAPAQNAGFLRPDAALAIVMVTNEDDCSAPINSTLFDPASRFVSDPLGPLSSYRCNEFGHLCGGQKPTRSPKSVLGDDLTGTCTSAEDGRLWKVAEVAARLKALKSDPSLVSVSAIAGPVAPYKVVTGAATLKDDPIQAWPQIEHSCLAADQSFADPAVRIKEWTQAFGARGTFSSVCDGSFQPALAVIAKSVGTSVDLPCLDAKVLDTDPVAAGVQPDCAFVDHLTNASGMRVDSPLASCAANGNVAPCWTIAADARCGAGHLVTFNRPAAAGDLTTTGSCQLCGANDARPGCAP